MSGWPHGRMYPARRVRIGPRRNWGLIFLFPEVLRERWELAFSEFDCGSQIDVDRSKRRCMIVGWRPAIIGLKVFFVPCAGRLASPIFQRWMTLSIYRWIALPKALWFSNPCTASSFTAPRVMFRWNPNEPIPNGDHSKNRDRAGRCSTSAPTGVAFARSSFFRCKACNGWIDARDLVWIEDREGTLPHPAQDQPQ
jgi:hypothetical protein